MDRHAEGEYADLDADLDILNEDLSALAKVPPAAPLRTGLYPYGSVPWRRTRVKSCRISRSRSGEGPLKVSTLISDTFRAGSCLRFDEQRLAAREVHDRRNFLPAIRKILPVRPPCRQPSAISAPRPASCRHGMEDASREAGCLHYRRLAPRSILDERKRLDSANEEHRARPQPRLLAPAPCSPGGGS